MIICYIEAFDNHFKIGDEIQMQNKSYTIDNMNKGFPEVTLQDVASRETIFVSKENLCLENFETFY